MPDRTPLEAETNELLLTWDIPPGGVIVVAGGYSGTAAAMLAERYPKAVVHVYEPQPDFAFALSTRFKGETRIRIHAYALGEQDGLFPMTRTDTDGASFLGPDKTGDYPMAEWGKEMGTARIALFYCNIESYEHILIPHLIETGAIKTIDQLAVQLHAETPEGMPADEWMARLGKTHEHIWTAPLGSWHGWRRRK